MDLKEKLKTLQTDFDRSSTEQRISNLNGGVAIITVGAVSELEMREKKLRMEDALNATNAAIEDGIVVGGGVALLKAKKGLDEYIEKELVEKSGKKSLMDAYDNGDLSVVMKDGKVFWFEGSYSDYEANKRMRLGEDAEPHRVKYRGLNG